MTTWCRKLVLLLAVAVMPLQGAAATFSLLACLQGEDGHGAHAIQAGHNQGIPHDHGMQQDAQSDDGGPGNHADHLCCNYFVSALPLDSHLALAPDFPAQARTPQQLHDLFLPDRPQRPPLA
jgi:hypothetical protein